MTKPPDEQDWLRRRIMAYARWVRALRQKPAAVGAPPPADDRRVAVLARELGQLAKDIRRRDEETRRLLAIVEDVQSNLFLTDVLEHIYDGFKGLLPFNRIGCAIISEDGLYATAYWARSELGEVRITPGFTQLLAGSSLDQLTDIDRPRILNDLPAYLAARPESHSTRLIVEEGGRSSLTCPLIVGDRRVGFLFFTSREKNAYRQAHQETFSRLARQISAVVHHSRMYQRLVEENAELNRRKASLELQVASDPLTGVANRLGLDTLLSMALADHGAAFAVVMADIDHFKRVNDRYGHGVGDVVLKEFAMRLKSAVRGVDAVGRYGGEEFVVVLRDTDAAAMRAVAERLRRSIEAKPFAAAGASIPVTASFGAAFFAAGANENLSAESAVAHADRLLYRAKNEGRNRVVAEEIVERRAATPPS